MYCMCSASKSASGSRSFRFRGFVVDTMTSLVFTKLNYVTSDKHEKVLQKRRDVIWCETSHPAD